MHRDLYKHHKVSPHPFHQLHHHFWQEIWRIKVIKCPSNSSPQGDINSDANLKHNHNTNANPKFCKIIKGGLHFDIA